LDDKFEGKERDTETGNDDFGARYYSNRFGRWLSADWSSVPVPVPYANLSNPQTLNLYAMVSDDPESSADLDGHAEINCHEGLPACNDLGNELKPGECGFGAGGGGACRAPTPLESAWQFMVSETFGMAKQAANEVTGLANFINAPIDAGLAGLGINFQFGQGPLLEGGNPTEQSAMLGTSVALFFVPGVGEAKTPEAIKLAKSLASEAQVAGKATDVIAGFGAKGGKVLRDAERLAAEYGGKSGEWSKMTSKAYKAADGSVISTHWYERLGSQIKYEVKSIVDSVPWSTRK